MATPIPYFWGEIKPLREWQHRIPIFVGKIKPQREWQHRIPTLGGNIQPLREWQHRVPINLSIWGVQVLQNLIIFGLNWVEVAQNGLILWENGARHSKKLSKYPLAPQYTITRLNKKCMFDQHTNTNTYIMIPY